ncbi:hypothetical protein M2280_001091 [Prescottella agglutinans]|uniref:Transposase n=1 Tax=Prescottella agglutinans TaxID=1644129 RepID=A0ABT6M6F2_9NOCA|nr:hypothetical protein [Prescottella agglutinans]
MQRAEAVVTTHGAHPLHEISTEVHRCESWQWKRVMAVIEHFPAHQFLREVFERHRGAHRTFTADAFLASYLLTPMLLLPMEQTKITNVVRGWTNSQRRDVGLPVHQSVSYKMVNDALRRLRWACASKDYPDWDENRFAQALLDASLACHPPTGAVALDSTDLSTWARVRYRKPIVDADPDSPPPPKHPFAPKDPTHPHARRQGHHLPNAPVGRDGRYVYTLDPDARMGWRSATFEDSMHFCGYDLHVITDVPPTTGPQHKLVPHLARTLFLAPAGSNKGVAGLQAVRALGEIPKPRQLIADRAYNYVRNERFALPVWQLGYTTIYDLHVSQTGLHPGHEDTRTMWVDGTLYPTSLPDGLIEIPPISHDMDPAERARADRRHNARQAYAFVPHEARQLDGTRRYRGPAVPPVRLRCINHPISMRASHRNPTTSCARGKPCGCGITVTLTDEDFPDRRMPFQHGSLAWESSYFRRVGIESLFAELKANRMAVHRGYFRGFGLRRYTLLAGFTLAALNLLILHDWHSKRWHLDPWGRYLGEPEPAHTARTPRRSVHVCRVAPAATGDVMPGR